MSKRKIVPFGKSILRETASPVTEFGAKLHELIDEMADMLYEKKGRAGLAAPQIGVSQQIVVIDCGDGLLEMVNPYVVSGSGGQIGEEACLSLPGYYGVVRRMQSIKAGFFDRDGDEYTIEAEGFLARCIQHEIDHLKGILYTDHIKGGKFFSDETGEKADLDAVLVLSGKEA